MERQFLISSIGGALLVKGGGGVIDWIKGGSKKKKAGGKGGKGEDMASIPTFRLSMGPEGGMATMKMDF